MQDEHRLEQGRPALVARGLHEIDHAVERQFLVRERLKRPGFHGAQQLAERFAARHRRAQDHGVDEQADQPLEFGPRPVGDRRADPHVFPSGVMMQQRGEGGEQHHERRGALAAGERLQRGRRCARMRAAHHAAAISRQRWARLVGRQVERRQPAGEFPTPVFFLRRERTTGQPLRLPDGEIGVLQRQFRQCGRLAPDAGRVQRAQFLHEHAKRPAVADDVMKIDKQHVVARGQLEQHRADERPLRQIERPPALGRDPGGERGLARGGRRAVNPDAAQLETVFLPDQLDRLAALGGEGRAQDFVALDDGPQTRRQRRRLEPAAQPERERNVVGEIARFEHLQKPHALLLGGDGENVGFHGRRGGVRGAGSSPRG